MKKRAWILLGLLAFFGLPCHASANAGTPLMWAAMFHLVLGNALIGVGEGLLIGCLFSLRKWRSIGIMILANYFSAWVGRIVLLVVTPILPMDLNNGWHWFWVLAAGTYLFTLLLEWPFVLWCFRGTPDWFKRSWRGNVLAQTVSYALLFGWYWMASGTSLYTEMNVVPVREMRLSRTELVYYISAKEKAVYSCDLYGENKRWVCPTEALGWNDRLFVRPSETKQDTWDLMARIETKNDRNSQLIEVIKDFSMRVAPDPLPALRTPPSYDGTWFNFGLAAELDGTSITEWEFGCGFWAAEGLTARNRKTGGRVRFSYETLFGNWAVRNVTALPSEQAVFQLGDDQICVFDPETKQVALITHGRGPVVWFGK